MARDLGQVGFQFLHPFGVDAFVPKLPQHPMDDEIGIAADG